MDCSTPSSSVRGILQARILRCSLSLLQGISLTQGINLGLLHYRRMLYCLNHEGSPMVFVVVMYGCESWTIKKEDGWMTKNWCFCIVVLEKTVESPLDCKEIKPVNPKEINPEYSLEELMLKLKLQNFDHLMWRANSLKKTLMLGKTEGRRGRGQWKIRWFDSITDSVYMILSKLWEIVKDIV